MVEAKPLVQAIINNLNNLKQKMTGLKGTARLLAVSKTKPQQDIQAAFEAGQEYVSALGIPIPSIDPTFIILDGSDCVPEACNISTNF